MEEKLASTDFSFEDLRDTGVLWALNRVLFHPRGYALAITLDDEGRATGWNIQGDGSECWYFDPESDDEKFLDFEKFLAEAKENNHQPPAKED